MRPQERAHRVFTHRPAATPGAPGHPDFLFRPQGRGRLGNPGHYELWYFAVAPECAIGEVFGDPSEWVEGMFDVPYLPGSRRALGRFEIPDNLNVLDLDDANALLARGLRPTQVLARNRATTQGWALRIFEETNYDGSRKWAGVRWWSFQLRQWAVIGLWVTPGELPAHQVVGIDQVDLHHPAIVDAARTLAKPLR